MQLHSPWWAWLLLALQGLVWPHVAWWLALHSRSPREAEFRHIVFDCAAGGAWIAAMQFSLAPSAVMVAMLAMACVSTGGWRQLTHALSAQVIACAGVAALNQFAAQPQSTVLEIVCALPLLMVYPVAVASATYRLAVRFRNQNRLLAKLNRTEALTGLPNRRYWEEVVASELSRVQRGHGRAVLAMIDIDHFKHINDSLGHTAGDALLRRLAQIVRGCVRKGDTPGRYGGDEFGLVMPNISLRDAEVIAEAIRSRAAACLDEDGVRWTVSIGLAEARADTLDTLSWISGADAELYRAKSQGRNRVCSAPAELGESRTSP